jgi:phosphoglycolate phosphatase
MIKCVIFDLDGTLINTLEDLMDATNEVMAEKGYPTHGLEATQSMVGRGGYTMLNQALPEGKNSHEETLDAFEKFKVYYKRRLTNKTRPYAGIEDLLTVLENRGIQFAVHTNKPQEAASIIVGELFPDRPFVDVVGYRSEETKKPDPHYTLEIAEKAGLKPEECLFVGDSLVDFNTGKNAGMKVALVTWGFRSRSHLSQADEAILVDKPKEILELM